MRRRRVIAVGLVAVWAAVLAWNDWVTETEISVSSLPAQCDAPESALDATLFLVGDAGAPRAGDPLLAALRDDVAERVRQLGAERVAIAFLGDNVYPRGLRAASHPARAEDERRLLAQLEAVRASGARGFFVPGNHDWDDGGDAGWDAVKRQSRFVAARGAAMAPPLGCAGPVARPLGRTLELVFLDTQWWLHRGPKPRDAASGCAALDAAGVERALAAALAAAAHRHAIVMAHHPLATGGPHGARFGLLQHLFPFRELAHGAWIPVPIAGSIWPLLRMRGVGDQDVTSPAYRALAAALGRAFAAAPPLVFAAGHDHDLQLIRGGPARYQVVSGAGSAANTTWALPIDGTLYAAARPGWMRVDGLDGGGVEIDVRVVGETGAESAHRACLTAP
jgi:hypothetical protein